MNLYSFVPMEGLFLATVTQTERNHKNTIFIDTKLFNVWVTHLISKRGSR